MEERLNNNLENWKSLSGKEKFSTGLTLTAMTALFTLGAACLFIGLIFLPEILTDICVNGLHG